MKTIALIRTELRRLTSSPMAILALVALMMIPVLYSGLYLWGNDDPYGNLDDVPAALVIEDTGATDDDGEHVNYGETVRDNLLDDGTLDWQVTTSDTAAVGLKTGEYDFIVTLGPDFSTNLTSIADDDPTRAVVELTTNDSNSYIARTIADKVTDSVRQSLTQEVGETAARTLLDGLATVRSGLVDAASGADQLAEGATSAHTGATTLADGTGSAADGGRDLANGLVTLNSSAAELPGQISQLNDGAHQVADGNAQLAQAVTPAAERVGQAIDALPTEDDMRARLTEQGFSEEEIAAIVGVVSPGREELTNANTQVQEAASAVQQLADGSRQVAEGTQRLSDGIPALTDGIASAARGANDLSGGLDQLRDGSNDLANGLGELESGSAELASGLSDAVSDIPDQSEEERGTAAAMMSDPVTVSSSAFTEASSYGAGMAPFFISLAGWIGIYALFLIVKPYSQRAVTALRRPLPITLGAWATPALLGALQMAAVFSVLSFGLGYEIAMPGPMLAFMVLTSVTFAAIILCLNVLLGSVGQFLGLVMMVLQLVTAGGTFPWQTLPAPLRTLHQVLPMSHSVDGMRQLMYGGDMARAWADVWSLMAWLIGALIVAFVVLARMTRQRTLRDLRPSLIG
ncbi:YhgE/Pip domain-containing protein [Microbacterium amylolyticum]|uniref:Membrane protein n=1 Tax=Microbacterium amylolyticum TaxID=936337 RepID=A0ABS4ZII6_9MICO|nr:YhgE/Pip domain-containing protein [Microbacterium amylolyticum]MBP2437012.1 putative membrane protein [Microbacterium amylolyticum]